jgi:hypothetical protein
MELSIWHSPSKKGQKALSYSLHSKIPQGTEKQKLNWILLKMSEAMKKDKLKCPKRF